MNSRDFWPPIIVGVVATPVCYVLAAFLSGGGHYLYLMILLFPYAMLLGSLIENISWFVTLPLFALQFPLYGAAFGAASVGDRFRPIAVGLAVAHFIAVMLGFVVEYVQQNQ
jgi:hypothetical protein